MYRICHYECMRGQMMSMRALRILRPLVLVALGIAIGYSADRALHWRNVYVVRVHASSPERGCQGDWSAEMQNLWSKSPSFADGGGSMACDESMEVSATLFIQCVCP